MGKALAGLVALLAVAVVGLDQWQARQGHRSLLGLEPAAWARAAGPAPGPRAAASAAGPRIAIIVAGMGARRDVLEQLRGIGHPLAVAVAPESPRSAEIADEARRAGMEVLVELPLEPYRYPEVDPGPGALTMAMPVADLGRRVDAALGAVPGAVGAIHHMGSRMTEDRERMRAVLEPLLARRLLYVDALTTNLSVAGDEAHRLGLRILRRQVLVDPAAGERGQRARWEEAARRARRHGEAVVVAEAHPLTAPLLREYLPAWAAGGLRVVPPSALAR